ncbi:MAG: leucine-rich repeat protein, partial [Acutalibacteraceae bacterium]
DAFSGCEALTKAEFPNATTIGEDAFSGCEALTKAEFPNATKIEDEAFFGCSALNGVNIPKATTIGYYAFLGCTALNTVDIPNAESIGEEAFKSCTSLTEAKFPKATTIGKKAFCYCSSLTEVNIPKATTIGEMAFSDCRSLTTVNIPKATTIGYGAFSGCTALKEEKVNIPNMATIDESAFVECPILERLREEEKKKEKKWNKIDGVIDAYNTFIDAHKQLLQNNKHIIGEVKFEFNPSGERRSAWFDEENDYFKGTNNEDDLENLTDMIFKFFDNSMISGVTGELVKAKDDHCKKACILMNKLNLTLRDEFSKCIQDIKSRFNNLINGINSTLDELMSSISGFLKGHNSFIQNTDKDMITNYCERILGKNYGKNWDKSDEREVPLKSKSEADFLDRAQFLYNIIIEDYRVPEISEYSDIKKSFDVCKQEFYDGNIRIAGKLSSAMQLFKKCEKEIDKIINMNNKLLNFANNPNVEKVDDEGSEQGESNEGSEQGESKGWRGTILDKIGTVTGAAETARKAVGDAAKTARKAVGGAAKTARKAVEEYKSPEEVMEELKGKFQTLNGQYDKLVKKYESFFDRHLSKGTEDSSGVKKSYDMVQKASEVKEFLGALRTYISNISIPLGKARTSKFFDNAAAITDSTKIDENEKMTQMYELAARAVFRLEKNIAKQKKREREEKELENKNKLGKAIYKAKKVGRKAGKKLDKFLGTDHVFHSKKNKDAETTESANTQGTAEQAKQAKQAKLVKKCFKNAANYIVKFKLGSFKRKELNKAFNGLTDHEFSSWKDTLKQYFESTTQIDKVALDEDKKKGYKKASVAVLLASLCGLPNTDCVISACEGLKEGGLRGNFKGRDYLNDAVQIRKDIKTKAIAGTEAVGTYLSSTARGKLESLINNNNNTEFKNVIEAFSSAKTKVSENSGSSTAAGGEFTSAEKKKGLKGKIFDTAKSAASKVGGAASKVGGAASSAGKTIGKAALSAAGKAKELFKKLSKSAANDGESSVVGDEDYSESGDK